MPTDNTDNAPTPALGQGDPLYVLDEELSAAEAALVDDAVTHINAAVNRSGVDLATDLATYILDTFFDGRYADFEDPDRYKARSFTALCQRPDLTLSQASLYALVRVGHQVEELPPATARALSIKHHRALLPIADPDSKVALAHKAIAEGWNAATLEAEVRATRGPTRRGRHPLPPVIKAFRAVQRTLHSTTPSAALLDLSDEQRHELETSLDALEAQIHDLRAALDTPSDRD